MTEKIDDTMGDQFIPWNDLCLTASSQNIILEKSDLQFFMFGKLTCENSLLLLSIYGIFEKNSKKIIKFFDNFVLWRLAI